MSKFLQIGIVLPDKGLEEEMEQLISGQEFVTVNAITKAVAKPTGEATTYLGKNVTVEALLPIMLKLRGCLAEVGINDLVSR